MQVDWILALELIVSAVLASGLAFLLLALFQKSASRGRESIFTEAPAGSTFLFDGETLLDATPGARALLALSLARGGPWHRLLSYLTPRFPGFETRMAGLAAEGRMVLTSAAEAGEPLLLEAELRGGLVRITLHDRASTTQPRPDHLAQRALLDELDQLRATMTLAPLPVWREDSLGDVVWANGAYLTKAMRRLEPGRDLTWPLPRLFERTASTQGAIGQRQRLDVPGSNAEWFDLIGFAEGTGRLLFALPADTAVKAEASLLDFRQTLVKTYADLPIGLAIFDQQRHLALFNPALGQLTGLAPDFLALKPTLFAFLDALRENQMIPEPKDYRGWRKEMMTLEKQATMGIYEETWSLPSGQTYRVIGRPHPNGALALMFEDISTEMSRTRRYRADLELGQAVIDAMDEAIAVFSQAGQLVMSNAAYAVIWGHDPASTLAEGGISQLCAHWRSLSAPSPIWAEAEQFVSGTGDRVTWNGEARLTDGRLIACRFAPLTGGATLASFRILVAGEAPALNLASTRKTA